MGAALDSSFPPSSFSDPAELGVPNESADDMVEATQYGWCQQGRVDGGDTAADAAALCGSSQLAGDH